MAAVAGDKFSVGSGLWCISDTSGADLEEWAAEAAGTICEIVSIRVGNTLSTLSTFAVKDAAGNFLIQAEPVTLTKQVFVDYAPGIRPRLSGLTVDTPTFGASCVVNYSIIYRVVG